MHTISKEKGTSMMKPKYGIKRPINLSAYLFTMQI